MKKKFIALKRYQEIVEPREGLSYSNDSPFDSINIPSPEGIFIAWHGPEVFVLRGGTGTAYVCRTDEEDPKPLNFDVYSIRPTKNSEIIEITLLPKQKYHWADDVPDIMKESVPEWIKERITKIKKTPKE